MQCGLAKVDWVEEEEALDLDSFPCGQGQSAYIKHDSTVCLRWEWEWNVVKNLRGSDKEWY